MTTDDVRRAILKRVFTLYSNGGWNISIGGLSSVIKVDDWGLIEDTLVLMIESNLVSVDNFNDSLQRFEALNRSTIKAIYKTPNFRILGLPNGRASYEQIQESAEAPSLKKGLKRIVTSITSPQDLEELVSIVLRIIRDHNFPKLDANPQVPFRHVLREERLFELLKADYPETQPVKRVLSFLERIHVLTRVKMGGAELNGYGTLERCLEYWKGKQLTESEVAQFAFDYSTQSPTPKGSSREADDSLDREPDTLEEASDLTFQSKIGQGASAHVWSALESTLNRTVAIKLVWAGERRALNHAQTLAKAAHPNIVNILYVKWIDHPETQIRSLGIVLEHLDGKKLSDVFKNEVEPAECKRVALGIIDGLKHLHDKGLVHDDLHEGNIIITDHAVKIIDVANADLYENLTTLPLVERQKRDISQLKRILMRLFGATTINQIELSSRLSRAPLPDSLTELREEFLSVLDQATTNIASSGKAPTREEIKPRSPADSFIEAIENAKPNQGSMGKRYMQYLADELVKLAPDPEQQVTKPEILADAINKTLPLVLEFAKVAHACAAMDAADAVMAIYKNFDSILIRYENDHRTQSSFRNCDFDFYKFVGHELLVILVAMLLQEKRHRTLKQILAAGIYVERGSGRDEAVGFEYFSQHSTLLAHLSTTRQRVSIHADLLNDRHTTGELATLAPMKQFMDADYFLFLRGELPGKEPPEWIAHIPWSSLYAAGRTPRFIAEASYMSEAKILLDLFDLPDLATLKQRLKERAKRLGEIWRSAFPWGGFSYKPDDIGTR